MLLCAWISFGKTDLPIYNWERITLAIPDMESMHIGASNTHYTTVDANTHNVMALCITLQPPIPYSIAIIVACSFGTHGRHLYVSPIRGGEVNALLQLYEIEVYMGK